MDPSTLAGALFALSATIVGTELIKTKVMQWLVPPPRPWFGEEEKKVFYKMKNILNSIPTEAPTLTKEEHEALMSLLNMHATKDQDGIPLWYVPRSWHKTQEEMLKVTREITFAQKETAKALEGVTKVVERLADRVADLK